MYYVEPPAPPQQPAVVEPPLPGAPPGVVWEPPPPPEPRHVAPKTSLWVGARLGWFIPLGYIFERVTEQQQGSFLIFTYDRVSWRDYADPGPMFEIDVGARLGRNYNVFALWERGELGASRADPDVFGVGSSQERGDTDYWASGLRASSDADDIGLLTEVALGYRRARTPWKDGTELRLSSSFLEARLGVGADIRLDERLTLSPMLTFGAGTFGDIEIVDPSGRHIDQFGRLDEYQSHGWLTLQLGAHFDVFGKKK